METGEKFAIGFVGFIALLILTPIVLVIIPFFTGIHYETGHGEHNGYITAVEKYGFFWKTGRAYLKTDTQSSQEDAYCVVDEKVYEQLQQAVTTKEHVVVSHRSWFIPAYWECGKEGAVIYAVKMAD